MARVAITGELQNVLVFPWCVGGGSAQIQQTGPVLRPSRSQHNYVSFASFKSAETAATSVAIISPSILFAGQLLSPSRQR